MKIRVGFVSNSSSCSFTCDVCGHTVGGFDQSPSELGMAECEYGHTFCQDHLLDMPETDRKLNDDGFDEKGFDESGMSEDGCCLSILCPICQMKSISNYDMDKYVHKMYGKSKKELEAEIRSKFSNYEDFSKWLNGK